MAKRPHKFAWNGVDIDTVLSARDLATICAQAAVESTGDLWNGKQRIEKVEDGDGWTLYVIKNALLGWQKPMSFSVDISADDGLTKLTTTIETYTTTQQTVLAFIPVSPKKMVAHHTYMQFAHKVANTVRAADPAARIRFREGLEVPGARSAPMVMATAGGSTTTNPATIIAPEATEVTADAPAPAELLPPPPPPPGPTLAPPPPPPPPPTLPVAAPLPAMQAEATTDTQANGLVDDVLDDSTRKVPRRPRASRSWELAFPDGSKAAIGPTVLVGRDPVSDDPAVRVFAVPDGERLVSKTHARFDLRGGVLFVTDLHSGNGTFLVAPNGDETQCEPDVPKEVLPGWDVELGSYSIAVRNVR